MTMVNITSHPFTIKVALLLSQTIFIGVDQTGNTGHTVAQKVKFFFLHDDFADDLMKFLDHSLIYLHEQRLLCMVHMTPKQH